MIGRTLGGRYEILEKIDAGGMAYVFKARCKKTQRIVAVKVLKQKFADSAEYVNRFKKEAQAVFALDHQHVVQVNDVGFDNGIYYMVMEYINGPSLKTLIEQKGGLSERQALEYAIQVCSALAAAHKKGIVHRDIKPQNILINSDGLVKVTDFGIAKSITSGEEHESQVIGSVYYISPEQAKGERIDGRSDIYSLGIVLYEMLTGTRPFSGDKTVSIALKHINEQMTPPDKKNETISKSANNIVMKAASKQKRSRYRNMNEFKEDLMRALVDKDGEFVDVAVANATIKVAVNTRKHNIWKIAVLTVLATAVAAIAVFSADAFSPSVPVFVSVPQLVGQTSVDAERALLGVGLDAQTTSAPSETVSEGSVMAQAPEAGSEIAEGETVVLTVSSGPDDMVMPDVSGMSETEAVDNIEEMKLAVGDITYEPREDVMPGIVLAQEPEARAVITGDELISLVVSAEVEQETTAVPQVVGLPFEQAVGLMYDSGFSGIYIYEEENDAEPGTVVTQSPEQGVHAPLESNVYLWISRYKDKRFFGILQEVIKIDEIESDIKVVVEETVADNLIGFVIAEPQADSEFLPIDEPVECLQGGMKTVKVYINNEVAYVFEVEMTERSNVGEG